MTIQNKAAGYENTDVSNTINLLVEQTPTEPTESLKLAPVEDNVSSKWFEERHTADTDTIDNLHAKCATLERKLANQSERYDIDMRNMKDEVKRLNAALTIHAKDEQLVFLLAGKVASVGNRLIEPLEDGRH